MGHTATRAGEDVPEWKEKAFMRACGAEFLATLLFVFFNCGNAVASGRLGTRNATLQISLCFGLTITVLAHAVGHVSGGHINPAVSIALCATKKVSMVKCGCYVISQCLGAIIGAAILKGVLPSALGDGNLGATLVSSDLSVGKVWAGSDDDIPPGDHCLRHDRPQQTEPRERTAGHRALDLCVPSDRGAVHRVRDQSCEVTWTCGSGWGVCRPL